MNIVYPEFKNPIGLIREFEYGGVTAALEKYLKQTDLEVKENENI